jgi:hypothetical protein
VLPIMNCSLQVLSMLAQSTEFENMQVREEELEELDRLSKDACEYDIKGGPENKHGKAAILMQVSLLSLHPPSPLPLSHLTSIIILL